MYRVIEPLRIDTAYTSRPTDPPRSAAKKMGVGPSDRPTRRAQRGANSEVGKSVRLTHLGPNLGRRSYFFNFLPPYPGPMRWLCFEPERQRAVLHRGRRVLVVLKKETNNKLKHSVSSTEHPRKREEARRGNIAAPGTPCALRSQRALGAPRAWRAPLGRGAVIPLELGAWHAERLPRAYARWRLRRVDPSPVALPHRNTPRKVSPKLRGRTDHKRQMPAGMRQVIVYRLPLGCRRRRRRRWKRLWRRRRRRRRHRRRR